jgi:integrase
VWAASGRRDGKDGGLSPRTRRHVHRILSSALSGAVEQQLIPRNPCDAFKALAKGRAQRDGAPHSRTISASARRGSAFARLLACADCGRHRRCGAARRWPCDGRTSIWTAARSVLSKAWSKRGASCGLKRRRREAEAITLPAFAVDELRRFKREQAESLLMLGVRRTGDTLVCARRDRDPLQPQSLTHEFPMFLARLESDFPRVRFHDLRHSHATQLLLAGVHPKVAQERLEHSTIAPPSMYTATSRQRARGRRERSRRRFPECYKHPLRPK